MVEAGKIPGAIVGFIRRNEEVCRNLGLFIGMAYSRRLRERLVAPTPSTMGEKIAAAILVGFANTPIVLLASGAIARNQGLVEAGIVTGVGVGVSILTTAVSTYRTTL